MDIVNNNQGLKRKIPSNHVESQNKSQKIVKSGKPNAQKHQQQFRYGNYANYYQKRYGQSSDVDIRITMLQPHHEFFTDKKVLDIGCNSGDFSFELARSFRIKSLLGVDIDGGLIEKARSTLQRLKTENDESIISDVLSNVTFRKVSKFSILLFLRILNQSLQSSFRQTTSSTTLGCWTTSRPSSM